jgi:hypothetical protein
MPDSNVKNDTGLILKAATTIINRMIIRVVEAELEKKKKKSSAQFQGSLGLS